MTTAKAREVADHLGFNANVYGIEQFRRGLEVEQEHADLAKAIKHAFGPDAVRLLFGSDLGLYGVIAWAHLGEFHDYYTRLDRMERAAR